jgi:hypothetical protein
MLYRVKCDVWVIMNSKLKEILKMLEPVLRHYTIQGSREGPKRHLKQTLLRSGFEPFTPIIKSRRINGGLLGAIALRMFT